MHTISLKLDHAIVKQIDKLMKAFNYSTKTEFIRDAIRDKLKKLEEERAKEKAWQALFAARGKLKGKGRFKTDEEFYKWRHGEGSKEMMAYFEKKFGINQK